MLALPRPLRHRRLCRPQARVRGHHSGLTRECTSLCTRGARHKVSARNQHTPRTWGAKRSRRPPTSLSHRFHVSPDLRVRATNAHALAHPTRTRALPSPSHTRDTHHSLDEEKKKPSRATAVEKHKPTSVAQFAGLVLVSPSDPPSLFVARPRSFPSHLVSAQAHICPPLLPTRVTRCKTPSLLSRASSSTRNSLSLILSLPPSRPSLGACTRHPARRGRRR